MPTSDLEVHGASVAPEGDACSVSIFWPEQVCSYVLYTPANCSNTTIAQIRAELVRLEPKKLFKKGVLPFQGTTQANCEKALGKRIPPLSYPPDYREPVPLKRSKGTQDFNNMKYIVGKPFKFFDGKMGSFPSSWEHTTLANLLVSNIHRKGHMCEEESSVVQDAVVKVSDPKHAKLPKFTLSILRGAPDPSCMIKLYWYKSGIPLKMKTECGMTLRKMKEALKKTDKDAIKHIGMAQNPAPFDEKGFEEFIKVIDSDFDFYVVDDDASGGHMKIMNSSPIMDSPFHRDPSNKEGPPEIHNKNHRLYSGCGIEVLMKSSESQGFVPPTDIMSEKAHELAAERVREEEMKEGKETLYTNPAEVGGEESQNFETEGVPNFAGKVNDDGQLVPQ